MVAEGRGPGQVRKASTPPPRTGASHPLRILVFSASLRADSLNARLAALAATTIEAGGHTTDLATAAEFDAPSYNGDVEAAGGLPPARAFDELGRISDAELQQRFDTTVANFLSLSSTAEGARWKARSR
jgi:hypothetical protein